MKSYATENIKHHRNILLLMIVTPLLVIFLVGAVFYSQTNSSNPTIKIEAQSSYPAEVRPFDPSHPVYQKVPSGAKLLPNSAQIVANIASNNRSFGFDTGGESPPIYVGKATDPLWNLSGGCGGRSVQFHAPSNVKAGSGADYPLIVLDQSNSSFTSSGTQPIEFRMWQARVDSSYHTVSANGVGIGSYRNDGALLSNLPIRGSNNPTISRALGQAEACGQNTGSGESYTVGMIRPIDIQRGYIDHAMRVAAGYLRGPANGNTNNKYWHWPALRTEGGGNSGYLADNDSRVPMGARIFLDKSVDVNVVGNAAAAKLSDPKNKAFAKMFVKALQDYGMIPLDGTGGGSNVYFEGDATANWNTLIGAKNSYGSYNDISRAVAAVLPWTSLRVADSSVFNSYAHSNSTTTMPPPQPQPQPNPNPSPNPLPTPSPPTIPDNPPPLIEVPGANTTDPVDIPQGLSEGSDGSYIADFTGDGLNEIAKDTNNDGKIDPKLEIVAQGSENTGLTNTTQASIIITDKNEGNSGTMTFKPGPLPEVRIAKPVAYTFLLAQGLAITGISTYLAITKLALFAGIRGRLGL